MSDMLAALGPRLQRLSMRFALGSLAGYMYRKPVSLVPMITEHCPLLTHLEVDNPGSSGSDVVQPPRQTLRRQVPACSGAMVYRSKHCTCGGWGWGFERRRQITSVFLLHAGITCGRHGQGLFAITALQPAAHFLRHR